MNKNYWKSDNENGYAYQKLAVANAISAIISKKEEFIELKGISWGIIEDVLDAEKVTYDYSRVYEPDYDLSYSVYVFSVENDKCLFSVKGNHASGDIIIYNEDNE